SSECQPLGHGAGGTQAGEGSRAAPEDDRVQLPQAQAGPPQQIQDGRYQRGRSLRSSCGLVHQQLRRAAAPSHCDGHGFGAGVEGEQIQGMFPMGPVIIEAPDNRRMPLLPRRPLLRQLVCCLLALAVLPLSAQALPPEVDAALLRAKLPRDAIALLVVDAEGKAPARLSHRTGVPVNPASIAKLATTFAGLELLGPAFTWSTPVYLDGAVRDGTLHGNLYIK